MKTHALTPKRESCWLEVTGSVARITHDGNYFEHRCNDAELSEARRALTARDVTAFAHVVIGYLDEERGRMAA